MTLAAWHDLRDGDWLRGSLRTGKAALTATRTAARLFEVLKMSAGALRLIGGASAGIDLATGSIAMKRADNRYGRMVAGGTLLSAGLRIGLIASAAAGPAAPALLGGVALIEAAKYVLAWKEQRYVPPVASELVAGPLPPEGREG